MKTPPTEEAPVRVDPEARPFMTGEELLKSGLIGLWKKRKDIRSSTSFARGLRARASKRARS